MSSEDCYSFLAPGYDQLTADVHYPVWADYIQRHFARSKRQIRTVLDLACGTGSLTRELALRGYEMIGVDRSSEMLALAEEKCRDLPGEAPVFLNQSMQRLDLFGDIDACVCCLDSVNYILKPSDLLEAFTRVHLFLHPGGLFLFDVRTPVSLQGADGQVFLDETEQYYCVWRGSFSGRRRVLTYALDLFQLQTDGRWSRGGEIHEEFAYEMEELESILCASGFRRVRRWGCLRMRAPRPDEERVFFTAEKEIL